MIKFQVSPKFRQYIIVIFADLMFFQLGMHSAWLSPLIVQLKDTSNMVLPLTISDEQAAWLVSISSIGCLCALLCSGYLTDHLGRKHTFVLGAIPRLIHCVLFLTATDVWMLMLGRVLSGVSDAFCFTVSYSYVLEIASKEIRGGLGTICQVMSASGSMLILTIGPFLDYMTLCIIITCITVVTFVPLLFLPESPYLLYSKGQIKESMAVLTLVRNKDSIEAELTEYSLNLNNKTEINKLELLKDCVLLKTFGKVAVLAIGSQMTGFNAVMFNLQTVFESTHTSLRPENSSAIIGCIQVLACFVAFVFIDRFGRKPIMIYSFMGLTIGMVGLGTFFRLRDEQYEIIGFLNYLPLASLILAIFCYNTGVGATLWTVCSELFEGPSRAIGVSFAVFIGTIFTFLTTRYVVPLSMEMGPAAVYWTFGACCVATSIFIIFCIPETKGKTFSEIQRDMGRINKAFERSETIESQTELSNT